LKSLNKLKKANKDKCKDRRITAVLMRANGKSFEEIRIRTEYNVVHISHIVAKYFKNGINALCGDNYKANRVNLTFDEEEAFLSTFF
jgi:hypothetical protein